jgi:hypothetical protein
MSNDISGAGLRNVITTAGSLLGSLTLNTVMVAASIHLFVFVGNS